MIIAIGQTKGGVGKTTLAVNFAVEMARAGHDVLLIDADEQATAMDFTDIRSEALGTPGYTCVKLSGMAVYTQASSMKSKYTHIIIDAGGRDTGGLRAALTVADVAVVPFQPRSFDLWTLTTMSRLVSEAKTHNHSLRAVSVLNCCDPVGSDNADAAQALKDDDTIEWLNVLVGRRKAFSNAVALGIGVCEMKKSDPKANTEIANLIESVFKTEAVMV